MDHKGTAHTAGHSLSLRPRAVRTIGTCQGTCGTRSEPHWLVDDVTWQVIITVRMVFTGRCLAMPVGKPSHNYHPKGLYTSARSPGKGRGGGGGEEGGREECSQGKM